MLFALKKVVGALLLPLPLLLMLTATGLLLLWFSRWQKSGKIIVSCAWLLLLLASLQPVADRLLAPVENHYPTWQDRQHVDYVVVLGGGYTWNPDWAPGSNMIGNSLPRLVEGIRLWRENPGSKMIFTGAAAQHNPVSSAEVTARVAESLGVPRTVIDSATRAEVTARVAESMTVRGTPRDSATRAVTSARVAESLGVPRTVIVTLDKPRDTSQEAMEVAKVVGDRPFLLVTSASHLPRAMIFFQQQGLHPLPAPANQLAITSPLNFWETALPSPLWLGHSERAIYETLGRVWQGLTSRPVSGSEPGNN